MPKPKALIAALREDLPENGFIPSDKQVEFVAQYVLHPDLELMKLAEHVSVPLEEVKSWFLKEEFRAYAKPYFEASDFIEALEIARKLRVKAIAGGHLPSQKTWLLNKDPDVVKRAAKATETQAPAQVLIQISLDEPSDPDIRARQVSLKVAPSLPAPALEPPLDAPSGG